jgi:acetyl-CoA carboxylase biotin carboxyl carrier protein
VIKKTPKTAQKSVAKAAAKAAAKSAPKAAAKPETKAPAKIGGIESDLVRHLATVLDETNLTEIEYESGGLRIRVARGGREIAPVAYAPAPAAAAAPAAVAAVAAAAEPAAVDPAHHPGAVKSPMVGVAYLLPEPGAPPFIKVGDQVAEGQTLLLVEAMKTFNPVKAPRAGKITQILVETGSPVEYGEPLVILT